MQKCVYCICQYVYRSIGYVGHPQSGVMPTPLGFVQDFEAWTPFQLQLPLTESTAWLMPVNAVPHKGRFRSQTTTGFALVPWVKIFSNGQCTDVKMNFTKRLEPKASSYAQPQKHLVMLCYAQPAWFSVIQCSWSSQRRKIGEWNTQAMSTPVPRSSIRSPRWVPRCPLLMPAIAAAIARGAHRIAENVLRSQVRWQKALQQRIWDVECPDW